MRLGWGFILTPEKPVEESVKCSVSTPWVAGGSWLKDEAEEEYVRVKYVLLVLDGIKRRCVALVWLASIWRVSDDGLHLRPGKEKCGGSQGDT